MGWRCAGIRRHGRQLFGRRSARGAARRRRRCRRAHRTHGRGPRGAGLHRERARSRRHEPRDELHDFAQVNLDPLTSAARVGTARLRCGPAGVVRRPGCRGEVAAGRAADGVVSLIAAGLAIGAVALRAVHVRRLLSHPLAPVCLPVLAGEALRAGPPRVLGCRRRDGHRAERGRNHGGDRPWQQPEACHGEPRDEVHDRRGDRLAQDSACRDA